MKFRRYSSIENSYRELFIDQVREEFRDVEYCVLEKIHGSNFSVWYDGTEFKYAKRGSFLNPEDNFYMFQGLQPSLEKSVKSLFAYWESPKLQEIIVYGELCGGIWPHPDVPKSPSAKKVQGGVFYHPENKFLVFDISVDGKFMDASMLLSVCLEVELDTMNILFRGSLQECLDFNPVFESNVFELPEIKDNFAEGVVIKPVHECYTRRGSRVILKHKNPKFAEKKKKEPREAPAELSPNAKVLLDEMRCFITEERLRSAISKIGEITQKDFGKIMKEFTADVLKDFDKDFGQPFECLDQDEKKRLTKLLATESAILIRANFLNIIDGTY